MAISARLVATEIVEYLDGITNVAAYLSQGPTPPVGKTVIVHPDAGQHDGGNRYLHGAAAGRRGDLQGCNGHGGSR